MGEKADAHDDLAFCDLAMSHKFNGVLNIPFRLRPSPQIHGKVRCVEKLSTRWLVVLNA